MRKRFTSRAYQTVQRRARAAQAGFQAGLIAHFDAQDGSSGAKGPPQSPAGPRSQPDPTKDTTATKIGQQRPMLAFPSGLRVLLVDGPAVRNHLDPDFCIGGHDLVYPDMIPAGEIWLERPGSAGPEAAVDLLGSLVHELAERAMMCNKGLTYERAHKAALALEADLRWQCNQARVHATCGQQFAAARRTPAGWTRVSSTEYNRLRSMPAIESAVRSALNEGELVGRDAGDEVRRTETSTYLSVDDDARTRLLIEYLYQPSDHGWSITAIYKEPT